MNTKIEYLIQIIEVLWATRYCATFIEYLVLSK